jgi:predicted lipoprotein with Yx(FWY)xxD motif
MMRSKPLTFLAGAAGMALIALAAAGCGGGGNGATAATAPSTTSASGHPAVGTAHEGNLGTILVDSQGRTLYLFQQDEGTKSECSGPCASIWPPLRASGKPTVGTGANASIVGTTTRSDGKPQVTYNGHPVYLYSGDQGAGDTNGQGLTDFGGAWYVLNPAGNQVSAQASNTGGGQSSYGGSGGY